ncbi:unnamed protein product [Amoebophrya sp. A120]|nr:unnamed protein product [Amoebophrya sp. A120]|eukprot:GSA120T00015524001.1
MFLFFLYSPRRPQPGCSYRATSSCRHLSFTRPASCLIFISYVFHSVAPPTCAGYTVYKNAAQQHHPLRLKKDKTAGAPVLAQDERNKARSAAAKRSTSTTKSRSTSGVVGKDVDTAPGFLDVAEDDSPTSSSSSSSFLRERANKVMLQEQGRKRNRNGKHLVVGSPAEDDHQQRREQQDRLLQAHNSEILSQQQLLVREPEEDVDTTATKNALTASATNYSTVVQLTSSNATINESMQLIAGTGPASPAESSMQQASSSSSRSNSSDSTTNSSTTSTTTTTLPHTYYARRNLTTDQHRTFTQDQLTRVEEKVLQLKKEIEDTVLLSTTSERATGCRKVQRDANSSASLAQKAELLRTTSPSGFMAEKFGVCSDANADGAATGAASSVGTSSPRTACVPLTGDWDNYGNYGGWDWDNTPDLRSDHTGDSADLALAGQTQKSGVSVLGNFHLAAASDGDGFFDRSGLEESYFAVLPARWQVDDQGDESTSPRYSSTGARITSDGLITTRDPMVIFPGVSSVQDDLQDEKNFDDCVAAQVGKIFVKHFGPPDHELQDGGDETSEQEVYTGPTTYVAYANFGFATTGRVVEWPNVDMNLEEAEEEQHTVASSFTEVQTSRNRPAAALFAAAASGPPPPPSSLLADASAPAMNTSGISSAASAVSNATLPQISTSATSSHDLQERRPLPAPKATSSLENYDARQAPWYEKGLEHRVTKNVVFAIDCSGSMLESGKWPAVKTAVQKAISSLTQHDRFSLFLYTGVERESWGDVFSVHFVVATEENKQAGLDWLGARDDFESVDLWYTLPPAAFLGLTIAAGTGGPSFPDGFPTTAAQPCLEDRDFCHAMVLLVTDADANSLRFDDVDWETDLQALFPVGWSITLSAYVVSPDASITRWNDFTTLSSNHGSSYPVLLDYKNQGGGDGTTGGSATTTSWEDDMADTISRYARAETRKRVEVEREAATNVTTWVRFFDPFTGRQRFSACTKIFSTGPYAAEEEAFRELKHYAVVCVDAALVLKDSFESKLRCLPFLKAEVAARRDALAAEFPPVFACPAYENKEARCKSDRSVDLRAYLYAQEYYDYAAQAQQSERYVPGFKPFRDEVVPIDPVLQLVEDAGGQVDNNAIRVTLSWSNCNDIDLHVITPSEEEVYWANKEGDFGGKLDVDMNVRSSCSLSPVENIRWARDDTPQPQAGVYTVKVVYFSEDTDNGAPQETDIAVNIQNGRDPLLDYTATLRAVKAAHTFQFTFAGMDQYTPPPPEEIDVGNVLPFVPSGSFSDFSSDERLQLLEADEEEVGENLPGHVDLFQLFKTADDHWNPYQQEEQCTTTTTTSTTTSTTTTTTTLDPEDLGGHAFHEQVPETRYNPPPSLSAFRDIAPLPWPDTPEAEAACCKCTTFLIVALVFCLCTGAALATYLIAVARSSSEGDPSGVVHLPGRSARSRGAGADERTIRPGTNIQGARGQQEARSSSDKNAAFAANFSFGSTGENKEDTTVAPKTSTTSALPGKDKERTKKRSSRSTSLQEDVGVDDQDVEVVDSSNPTPPKKPSKSSVVSGANKKNSKTLPSEREQKKQKKRHGVSSKKATQENQKAKSKKPEGASTSESEEEVYGDDDEQLSESDFADVVVGLQTGLQDDADFQTEAGGGSSQYLTY